MEWIADPTAWIGLGALVVLEIVLGIDNLIFVAILADRLPPAQRDRARVTGLVLALVMRLALLAGMSWIVTLTRPLFAVGPFEISGRGIILILGGLFLIFKATMELHERLEGAGAASATPAYGRFWQIVVQIIVLDAVFPLKMPDNCVTLYELPPEEIQLQTLEDAEKELRVLKERIRVQELPDDAPTLADRAATAAMYPAYANSRSVKKFWSDDSCVGCGVCAGRCPARVIEMIDGRPHWVHDRCARCMACLRCNAVQYGTKTVGRTRWVHPSLRKKKHAHE